MKLFTFDNEDYFAISKITKISKPGPFDYSGRCFIKILFDNGKDYEKSYNHEKFRDDDFDNLCKLIEEE